VIPNSSVAAVKKRDTDVLKDLANEFNLTYTAFGSQISPEDEPAEGTLTLIDAWGTALEPAPVTPTDGDPVWELFTGTVKATYNAQRGLEGDNIVVSPGILTGNTGRHAALVDPQWKVNYDNRHKALLGTHAPYLPLFSFRSGLSFPSCTRGPHGQRTYAASFEFELRLLIDLQALKLKHLWK
jgi:hypothetical protein